MPHLRFFGGAAQLLENNPKILQCFLKLILRREAGVKQEALFTVPFGKAAVVEHLMALVDDEGYNVVLEALLQHDQAPDSAVAVLERVNALEAHVEGDDILQRDIGQRIMLI